MTATEALRLIQKQGRPFMTTNDVAAWLGITPSHASQTLKRLCNDQLIIKLKNGLWGNQNLLKPFSVPPALTAPLPSAISLQTALAYHEMISQISDVIFAVTLARTKKYHTPLGVISLHHIDPKLFIDYRRNSQGFYIATPEKALFDIFYLARNKISAFKKLPEVELSPSFHKKRFLAYVDLVQDQKRRTAILRKYQTVIKNQKR